MKSLRTCPTPSAVIQAIADPIDYLKYTIKLDKVGGEVETVVWTIGNEVYTRKPGESITIPFLKAGTYPVRAVMQNVCANNTTVETTITVSPSLPVVATGRTESLSQTSATVLMVVSSAGSGQITEHGIVYGDEANVMPSLTNGGVLVKGPALSRMGDSLRVNIPGLSAGKRYNYRAYARNSAGLEKYGDFVGQFTTRTATAPTIDVWYRLLGGSNGDFAYAVIPTQDSGFLIVGNTASNNGDVSGNKGSYDAWVAKVDLNGTLIWQKSLGGSGDDVLWSAQVAADGNYILLGNTSSTNGDIISNAGSYDAWLVKISSSGNVLWSRTYGTANRESAFGLAALANGNYLFTSTTEPDGSIPTSIVRTIDDRTGTILSLYSITDSRYYSVCIMPSGGYMVVGNAGQQAGLTVNGRIDLLATRLNTNLNLSGSHITQGGADDDGANYVTPTSDNGFLLVGQTVTGSVSGGTWGPDAYIVKLTASGSVQWAKSYGGSKTDLAQGAIQMVDGSYLVVGSTESNDRNITRNQGGADVLIMKLGADGNLIWTKTYGGTGNDYGYKIQASRDGGYIIVGSTASNNGDFPANKGNADVLIMKIDSDGNFKR